MRKFAAHTLNKTSQRSRIDIGLVGVILVLILFGLVMVYDSSQVEAFRDLGDKYYFIKQQLIWVGLGLVGLTFFSLFKYQNLVKFAVPFLVLSLILLFMVFVPGLGVSAGGAHRWLKIVGMTIQPAEIIKLSTIIFLSALFQERVKIAPFLIILSFVSLVVGILQKDLGSTIIYVLISFGVYFVAQGPIKHSLILLLLGLGGFIGFVLISPYRIKRILAFMDPFADTQGFSYHISQILIALGSGGFFGLGIGQSRQKFSFIPEVTTDSIFSVIGEEFGFLGSVILISLFGFLIWRGLKISQNAPDKFGMLLGSGLIIWLGAQVVVNLSSMVSLMPLTGVPLPFISYGGSALLANLIAMGILLNISKQSTKL